MSARKLMRTIQSEFWFLKGAKEACYLHGRKWLRRPSEPDFACLRFLPDALGGCYVDVGANQGQSIEAIRLLKPAARVHAYEPNRRLAAMLERRHGRSPGIVIHACGLADTAQAASLFTPVYKGFVYDGLTSLDRASAAMWLSPETLYRFRAERLEVREARCRTERLDDEHLDPIFIKIDVQGGEYQVVAGGLQTIRRCEPVLMIEDLSHRPALGALLTALGYRQYRFDATGFYPADDSAVMNSLMMTAPRAATVIQSAPGARTASGTIMQP